MFNIAGVGPGDASLLTEEVREAILSADVVLAFSRVAKTFSPLREDITTIKTRAEILEYKDDARNILLLASGDPVFYGVTEYAKREGIDVHRVMPGISSVQYLAAKCQLSWQGAYLTSAHGREFPIAKIRREAEEGRTLFFFLLDAQNTPSACSKLLFDAGFRGRAIAGYDLSYPEERIEERALGETFSEPSALSILVVEICTY